jgi:hypothetical protein
MLAVEVENALFEASGHPHFYVHLRLVNLSNRAIGVDLRTPLQTAFPNQWGGSDQPSRQTIDERVPVVRRLDPATQNALRAAFRGRALRSIAPHASIDYYAVFNASTRSDVDAQARRYVLVTIRGELRATDGTRVEQLALDESLSREPDLVVSTPIRWSRIPASSLTIDH